VMDTDEKFSYTFTKAGTYSYYCSVHPKMTGQVVVKWLRTPSILRRDRYQRPFIRRRHSWLHARSPRTEQQKKRFACDVTSFWSLFLRRLLRCGFVGAAALFYVARIGAQSSAVETPEANPGRPTVSTPATLTPVGYLQFENGGVYSETSPEFTTLFGINQVTKLTVTSGLQLLALSEPLAQASGASGDALSGSRPGEVFAGFQAVVLRGEGHRPTVSLKLHSPSLRESRAGTWHRHVQE
jgi:copper binding plastocyanin/azurin family protein